MVVKNVAGLDIAKVMIGSFGTLAAITSVNFRLHPLPEETCTFVYSFAEPEPALARCAALRASGLGPHTMDLIGPVFAARLGMRGYLVALQAAGSSRVLGRYAREMEGSSRLGGSEEQNFWRQISEAPAEFLKRQPGGIVLRVSMPLSEMDRLLRLASGVCIARAGNGVVYVYLSGWSALTSLRRTAQERNWTAVLEYAPDEIRQTRELWMIPPGKESGFGMMKSVKQMFDPQNLLNRSRLYGRI
jgi:glycolate oxidase FAD binding subunit